MQLRVTTKIIQQEVISKTINERKWNKIIKIINTNKDRKEGKKEQRTYRINKYQKQRW